MKIGIAGAHGVGKTTLAVELSKCLNLPMIDEVARKVANDLQIDSLEELYYNKDLALIFQTLIAERQKTSEQVYKDTGFVSDRTLIDNHAYWYLYGLDTISGVDELLKSKRHEYDNLYDLIVYVPIEFSVQDDNFRFVCEGCRNLIDKIIRDVLKGLKITPVLKVSGTITQRVAQVIAELKTRGFITETMEADTQSTVTAV